MEPAAVLLLRLPCRLGLLLRHLGLIIMLMLRIITIPIRRLRIIIILHIIIIRITTLAIMAMDILELLFLLTRRRIILVGPRLIRWLRLMALLLRIRTILRLRLIIHILKAAPPIRRRNMLITTTIKLLLP